MGDVKWAATEGPSAKLTALTLTGVKPHTQVQQNAHSRLGTGPLHLLLTSSCLSWENLLKVMPSQALFYR